MSVANKAPPLAFLRQHIRIRLVITILATLALIIGLYFVPWSDVWDALRAANPWLVVAAIAINMAVYPLWVLQWWALALPVRRVPPTTMFEIIALSSMGSAAMNSFAGTASAFALLTLRGGMSAVAAGAFMAIDQVLVGLAKLALLALAVTLAPLPPIALPGALAFGGMVLVFTVLLFVLAYAGMRPYRVTEGKLGALLAPGFAAVEQISSGLVALRHPVIAGGVLALAFAKKSIDVLAALAVMAALGVEPSLTLAILIIAALGVTTAVPVVPGSLGVYSTTVFLVYQFMGYDPAIGLAAGILQHLAQLASPIIVGYATFVVARIIRGSNPHSSRSKSEPDGD